MNSRCAAVGLSLMGLLLLGPGAVKSADLAAPDLQLRFTPPVTTPRPGAQQTFSPSATQPTTGAAVARRTPSFAKAEPGLKERALQNMFASSDLSLEHSTVNLDRSTPQFHFERQGPAVRDLSRSYRKMCDNLSSKIWQEPNGRRIRFDIAGKPGIAMEIPLH